MKIGLFITGHFRNVPVIYENYAQFLDNHDTSVYIATWSSPSISRETHQPDLTFIDIESTCQATFGHRLKRMWVGDMYKFLQNMPPEPNSPVRTLWNDYIPEHRDALAPIYPWPQRVLDQWYAVKQAYLLASQEYDTFDVVIRIRGDQLFIGRPTIPIEDVTDGIHVNGYTWWHRPEDRESGILADSTGLIPYALSDQLAWGKPQWMRKYFEYYDHCAPIFAGRVNVWHGLPRNEFERPGSFLFNSEHMMSYYLLKHPYYHDTTTEYDMAWHRHGHDSSPHNRFDSDFYYLDPR